MSSISRWPKCPSALEAKSPFLAILIALSLLAPRALGGEPRLATGRQGMVVAVSPPAVDVGAGVLKHGGTAVDAAVAVALAMSVTWPEAGNIGGGGFMIVHPGAGREPVCIDYRETAPAAASETMYSLKESAHSHRFAGVPGTLRGLELAHKRFGKLPWKDLVAPAVRLAEEGFVVDQPLADSLNGVLRDKETARFAELQRIFAPPTAPASGGRQPPEEPRRADLVEPPQGADAPRSSAVWRAGDRLVQKELAATLRLIAAGGADAFYKGRIAEQIVAEMRTGGGLITPDDLAAYQAKERKPIHGTYRGYDIFAPPPPSSGGICLVEMLNILENFDLKPASGGRKPPEESAPRQSPQGANAPRSPAAVRSPAESPRSPAESPRSPADAARSPSDGWSADTVHLTVEAMRRAYLDRARYLGDPDFIKIPDQLTSKTYAAKLAKEIDRGRATSSEALAKDIPLAGESEETTHFSIVDGQGMAVANTYTLEHSFGCRVVVRGAGFLLNNEMSDFNPKPGHTDRSGRIGTKPNLIAPGKRMLSSQTPTIVTRDGKLVLVTGSPGGRTIINTVLCVVLNRLAFDLPPRECIAAPRLHQQWLPDVVRFEGQDRLEFKDLVVSLRERGHKLEAKPYKQGDAHSIFVDATSGELTGVADGRRDGAAKGY